MTFTIEPELPDRLELDPLTGEVSGKPTAFLSNQTFIVTGTHASDTSKQTTFDLSVTTKIDSIKYKQKEGKYIILELSSIQEIARWRILPLQ